MEAKKQQQYDICVHIMLSDQFLQNMLGSQQRNFRWCTSIRTHLYHEIQVWPLKSGIPWAHPRPSTSLVCRAATYHHHGVHGSSLFVQIPQQWHGVHATWRSVVCFVRYLLVTLKYSFKEQILFPSAFIIKLFTNTNYVGLFRYLVP